MIELIVDDRVLDLNSDEVISITKEIIDITDFDVRASDFTQDFNLPGSDNNLEFIENIFLLDKKTYRFDKNKRVPAFIRNGANEIIRGDLQVNYINVSNSEIIINVKLVGKLRSLITDTQDISINQLSFDEYNHIRNKETIVKSFDNEILLNNEFKIVENGRGYVYNYAIYDEEVDIPNQTFIYNLFPSVYIKEIWDKCFNFIGKEYESDFINSEYFKNIIIPFSNDGIKMDEEQVTDLTTVRGVTGIDDCGSSIVSLTPFLQPGSSWYSNSTLNSPYNLNYLNCNALNDITTTVDNNGQELTFNDPTGRIQNDVYICNKEGMYNIDINLRPVLEMKASIPSNLFSYEEGEFEYNWEIKLIRSNGVSEILNRCTEDGNTLLFAPSNSDTHIGEFIDLNGSDALTIQTRNTRFMNPGDKIVVSVSFRYPSTVKFEHPSIFIVARLKLHRNVGNDFSYFKVQPNNNTSYGNEFINMSQTLPDIKISDFIKSIIKLFKLVVINDKDNPNKFKFIPFDDYFSGGKEVDLTDIEDKNSKRKVKLNLGVNRYHLSYTEDSDYINKYYKSEYNKIYGDFTKLTGDEFTEKAEKMDILFAATPISNERIGSKVAPHFCDYKDLKFSKIKIKPRLLFKKTIQCQEYKLRDNNNDNNPVYLDKYVYSGMWDDPYNPTETLEFGNSIDIYHDTDLRPTSNLWNKFHQKDILNKSSEDYRIVETYIWLSSSMLSEMDFRNIYKLDNQFFRLIKIEDYQYSEELSLTKVVLEKLSKYVYTDPFINTNKKTYCPSDIKLRKKGNMFIYESETGQTITEQCCIEKGGTWDGSSCIIPFQNPVNPKPVLPRPVVPSRPTAEIIKKPKFFDFGDDNIISPDFEGIVINKNIVADKKGFYLSQNTQLLENELNINGLKLSQNGTELVNKYNIEGYVDDEYTEESSSKMGFEYDEITNKTSINLQADFINIDTENFNLTTYYWTFDFMDALNITIYADDNYSIDEITNIVNVPTITIQVNDNPYTLENPIILGDKIYIESDINSVIKIKIVK